MTRTGVSVVTVLPRFKPQILLVHMASVEKNLKSSRCVAKQCPQSISCLLPLAAFRPGHGTDRIHTNQDQRYPLHAVVRSCLLLYGSPALFTGTLSSAGASFVMHDIWRSTSACNAVHLTRPSNESVPRALELARTAIGRFHRIEHVATRCELHATC
ncbi:hypothetical protein AC579_241 [Pseudocercospora musae]|uniref:Uncharacterized protein n=1 Tax=Pseudocercospora musae TaxID=113226 RepID=A0A139I094_9PEZI|nr:hypothetical protein AC579_241 [Pseudocercospora musae]